MSKRDELFEEGVRLFNEQKYFECHEVLEELWNLQQEPEKQFTQGLIQIAVALYHLNRSNIVGARKLFIRGLQRIAPFQPVYRQIDVATLHSQTTQVLQQIDDGTAMPAATILLPRRTQDC